MDQKMDRPAVLNHIKNIAFDLSTDLFNEKDFMTGKDILQATKIDQVNFFILKILFNEWKREMNELKSPYFDYNDADVKKAMEALGEKLSFHIHIKKEVFVSLLEKAFEQYVDFLNNPFQFILNDFLPHTDARMPIRSIKDNIKYFKINTFFLQAIVDKIAPYRLPDLSYEDGKSTIMEVYEAKKGDFIDPKPFLSELKTQYDFPFDIASSPEVETISTPEIDDQPETITNEEPSSEEEHIPVDQAEPTESERTFEFDYTKKSNATLNDLYSEYSQTKKLNDQLKPAKEEHTILEKHQKSKINSLLNSIAINQKYHFINTLFHGDTSSYEETLNTLDRCATKDEASRLIAVDFTEKFGWDESKDMEVSKLLQLVERRF